MIASLIVCLRVFWMNVPYAVKPGSVLLEAFYRSSDGGRTMAAIATALSLSLRLAADAADNR